MGIFDRAIVSPGHHIIGKTARGDDVTVIARAAATNGTLGIWSSVIAPDTGPDWHTHTRETEVFPRHLRQLPLLVRQRDF